jgi:hypothetical protein
MGGGGRMYCAVIRSKLRTDRIKNTGMRNLPFYDGSKFSSVFLPSFFYFLIYFRFLLSSFRHFPCSFLLSFLTKIYHYSKFLTQGLTFCIISQYFQLWITLPVSIWQAHYVMHTCINYVYIYFPLYFCTFLLYNFIYNILNFIPRVVAGSKE